MNDELDAADALITRQNKTIEALEKQLAAQRAIVAADDEWRRVRDSGTASIGEILDAASAPAEAREAAKRIDEEAN